jgi:hypothetical protein
MNASAPVAWRDPVAKEEAHSQRGGPTARAGVRVALVVLSMATAALGTNAYDDSLPRDFEGSFVGGFGSSGTCYLTVSRKDRYWLGCSGQEFVGRIEVVGDGVLLAGLKAQIRLPVSPGPRVPSLRPRESQMPVSDPTLPLAVIPRATGPATWLKRVVWGQRGYLLPYDSTKEFCRDIGLEGDEAVKPPDGYFIRVGDDRKPRPKETPTQCQQQGQR